MAVLHDGVYPKAPTLDRLQKLLTEATVVENALDALYSQHEAALKRLASIGIMAKDPEEAIKRYHDHCETELVPIYWKAHRSERTAEPTLVTKVAGDEEVFRGINQAASGPREVWTTTSIERAENAKSKILLRAFANFWRELGWDNALKGNWYWVAQEVESKSTDTNLGHLRVTVLWQELEDGKVIHSYLKFKDA